MGNSTPTSEPSPSSHVRVKLPDIPIPKFNGNPRNFSNFRNLFESVIHNDTISTPIQKFYFLHGALIGDASSFLKGVNIVGNRYKQTWKDFCDEYGKKRLIISTHLHDLFNLAPIKTESGIQDLVNSIDVAVCGLNQCGENTESWSILLSYLLLSKLDYKTRSDFENSLTTNDAYPPYQSLRDFLNIRAANSTRREIEKPPNERKGYEKKTSLMTAVSRPKCCVCKTNHLLIECSKFNSLIPADRFKAVTKAKLCTNCFNRNHIAEDCRRRSCDTCNRKHHRLLHIDKTESPQAKPESFESRGEQSLVHKASNVMANLSTSLLSKTVLLPTAVVKVQCGDFCGSGRLIIDATSQATYVIHERLERHPSSNCSTVMGVGGTVNVTHECHLKISSQFQMSPYLGVVAEVMPESSYVYRVQKLRMGAVINKLKLMTLADPAFNRPVVDIPMVDIILGIKHLGWILSPMPKVKVVDGVEFMLTKFGWVIFGEVGLW